MDIAILGYGAMGHMIEDTANASGINVAAAIEPQNGESLLDVKKDVDAVLDFSNPANLQMMVDYAEKKTGEGKAPAFIIATTGYTDEQLETISKLSEKVPVVHTSNFSYGINIMEDVLRSITPILENDFDMEVIEMHHNRKLDAPSGTALMLANAMDPDGEYEKVLGRSGNCKRQKKEIGINAIRGGTEAGTHTVIYAGTDEILEITHRASSRKIFAVGALKAAGFAAGKGNGLYDMHDVLKG